MSSLLSIFNSSIGKKVLMALTGIFLTLFLIVHLIGNLQLLQSDSGLAFNSYAVFMTTNPFIKTVSWGLYAIILLHAIKGFALVISNRNSRSSRYVKNGSSSNSHWTSRNMGIFGTIILVFIVVHMSDFWWSYKFGSTPWSQYQVELNTGNMEVTPVEAPATGKALDYYTDTHHIVVAKDLFKKVQETFSNPLFVLFYVLSMLAISFHLWHGIASAFQSLGLYHSKYNAIIKGLGIVISVLIPIGFAVIPIIIYSNI